MAGRRNHKGTRIPHQKGSRARQQRKVETRARVSQKGNGEATTGRERARDHKVELGSMWVHSRSVTEKSHFWDVTLPFGGFSVTTEYSADKCVTFVLDCHTFARNSVNSG